MRPANREKLTARGTNIDPVAVPRGTRGAGRLAMALSSTSDTNRRARNLRRVQLAAIAIPMLVIVVACLVTSRHVTTAGEDRRSLEGVERDLVSLRFDFQSGNAKYWRTRGSAGPSQSMDAYADEFRADRARFARLAAIRGRSSEETDAIAETRTGFDRLATVVLAPRTGAPSAVAEQRTTAAVITIDHGLSRWIATLQREIDDSNNESDRVIAQLLVALGFLVAVLVAVAAMMWVHIDRQRRRVLDEVAAERDSSRLVMASVQDGLMELDELGRVKWMNRRMEDLTGCRETEMIGRPPPWADDVPTGFTGDVDLIVRRTDGTDRDVLLTVSRLAEDRGFLHVGKDMTLRRRAEAELRSLSVEREVLREVATFVAGGAEPAEVFALVARESATLMQADAAVVRKFVDDDDRSVDLGRWVRPGGGRGDPPARVRQSSDAPLAQLLRTGAAARVDDTNTLDAATAAQFAEAGYRAGVAVPIRVGDSHWGVLEVLSGLPDAFPQDAETRLSRFAELIGMTVSNADANARLADQAATDPLTGLANHRRFHERLRTQTEEARAAGEDLALVMIDLDRFSDVNATFGHHVGDEVLAETARRLAREARVGETVARVGGEEFAWILPHTDGLNAWRAAERARLVIAATPFGDGVGTVTASVGVADLSQAAGAEELQRLADGALYWAKATGRNLTLRYSPEVVRELSVAERAERLSRSHAVTALRALARAVDAKDPSTARHAERVATLSVAIARAMGWESDRLELLEEAALLHDVGKIGIPDAILLKPGRLDAAERENVMTHAALGAEIVSDVLSEEQVAWIRSHHERWDGSGYPDRLDRKAIPDGARIIAVADAWDAMTSVRTYGASHAPSEAHDEIVAQGGRQFAPEVVTAFRRVWALEDIAVAPRLD